LFLLAFKLEWRGSICLEQDSQSTEDGMKRAHGRALVISAVMMMQAGGFASAAETKPRMDLGKRE
jgi:hypothetical protein